ncbi:MAG: hypothetical protein HRU02_02310 [Myxococcales bacterium]|nr:hypothetical protein [Myxococcales bacterium]
MKRKIIVIVGMGAFLLWGGAAVADGDFAELGAEALALDVNLGSGSQTNADDWSSMGDVNAGGNQLTGGGINSNGGNRDSDDVALLMGDNAEVASYALEASVSNNQLLVDGNESHADSSTGFEGDSGFSSSYGITAVSVNAGSSASQSVNVNVTSAVTLDTF